MKDTSALISWMSIDFHRFSAPLAARTHSVDAVDCTWARDPVNTILIAFFGIFWLYIFLFTLLAFCGQQKKDFIVQRNMFPCCAYDIEPFESWIYYDLHFEQKIHENDNLSDPL